MPKILALILFFTSCAMVNPYEGASEKQKASFKEVIAPLPSGTKFKVGFSPFRNASTNYSWAFEVPYGTKVIAVEDGVVEQVLDTGTRGGCGPENRGHGHFIKIVHADKSVAMYLHLNALVKARDVVKKGQVIAETAKNGMVCVPNLHLTVYKDVLEAGKGLKGQTLPVRFTGLPATITQGYQGTVP